MVGGTADPVGWVCRADLFLVTLPDIGTAGRQTLAPRQPAQVNRRRSTSTPSPPSRRPSQPFECAVGII